MATAVNPVIKVIQQILCSGKLLGCIVYKDIHSYGKFWEKRCHLIPRMSSSYVNLSGLMSLWLGLRYLQMTLPSRWLCPALFPFSSSGVQKWKGEDKRMCGTCAACISNISVTAVGSERRRKETGETCCAQRKSACAWTLANDRFFL